MLSGKGRDYWLLSGFGASQDTAFLSHIVFAFHLAARFQFGIAVHFASTRPRLIDGTVAIFRRFRVAPKTHSPRPADAISNHASLFAVFSDDKFLREVHKGIKYTQKENMIIR